MLPPGSRIAATWEDEDLNRIFIVMTPRGGCRVYVRCGSLGVWLEKAKPLAQFPVLQCALAGGRTDG